MPRISTYCLIVQMMDSSDFLNIAHLLYDTYVFTCIILQPNISKQIAIYCTYIAKIQNLSEMGHTHPIPAGTGCAILHTCGNIPPSIHGWIEVVSMMEWQREQSTSLSDYSRTMSMFNLERTQVNSIVRILLFEALDQGNLHALSEYKVPIQIPGWQHWAPWQFSLWTKWNICFCHLIELQQNFRKHKQNSRTSAISWGLSLPLHRILLHPSPHHKPGLDMQQQGEN